MSSTKRDATMMVSHSQRQQIMAEIKASVDKINTLVDHLDGHAGQIIVLTKETLEKVTDKYISIMRANERIIRDKLLESDKKERVAAVSAAITAIIVYVIALPVVGATGAFVPATIAIKPGELFGVIYYKKLYRFYNWLEKSKFGKCCCGMWEYLASSKLGKSCANAWSACFDQEPDSDLTKEILLHKIEEASIEDPVIFNAISELLTDKPGLVNDIFSSIRKRHPKVNILDFNAAQQPKVSTASAALNGHTISAVKPDVKIDIENRTSNAATNALPTIAVPSAATSPVYASNDIKTRVEVNANGHNPVNTREISISIQPEIRSPMHSAATAEPMVIPQTPPAYSTPKSAGRTLTNSSPARPPSPRVTSRPSTPSKSAGYSSNNAVPPLLISNSASAASAAAVSPAAVKVTAHKPTVIIRKSSSGSSASRFQAK